MLVVSDSSPINFLIRMNCLHVLQQLFGGVTIPPQVAAELGHPNAPAEVRTLINQPPDWLRVQTPSRLERIPSLHSGEEAAICLAQELHADLILIDDGEARKAAQLRGLTVTGLLGVLDRADSEDLIRFAEVAQKLPAEYRIDARLVRATLERSILRRSGKPLP